MRILAFTVGLTAAASMAIANPPATHVNPGAAVQAHGNPHTTTPPPTTTTTTTTSGSSKTSTTTPATTSTTTLNPIAAKITSHPQLASKVTALLPTGMTLNQASRGFKNQGQFIAALHVSHNLDIPFATLRTEMVKDHLSLGQAIQKVKGTEDAGAVKTAEQESNDDIKPPTTTTTTSKKNNR